MRVVVETFLKCAVSSGPQWDPAFYQNPAGMVEELNSLNMQLMVSVWSKFDNTTTFYQTMEANGQMLGRSVWPKI